MSNEIDITGFDDMFKLVEDMTLTQEDEVKAMRVALQEPYKEVSDNAPYFKGFTKKSIKKLVKKEEMSTVGRIRIGSWDAIFSNFGSSRDKKHVGWFDRAIEKSTSKFLNKLAEELLKKAK